MKVLKVYPDNPNGRHISEAAEALKNGEIIVFPTDTVYAFGCDALNNRAVERLCRLKNVNPEKNLLSIICENLSEVSEYARVDNKAFRLLKNYLPGPFTFVLPASNSLPKVFKGRKSVGIRIPDNNISIALTRELGHPIMTSSIPLEDDYEIADGETFASRFENNPEISLIIDGGPSGFVPSTIIDCMESGEPTIIRQGAGIFE